MASATATASGAFVAVPLRGAMSPASSESGSSLGLSSGTSLQPSQAAGASSYSSGSSSFASQGSSYGSTGSSSFGSEGSSLGSTSTIGEESSLLEEEEE